MTPIRMRHHEDNSYRMIINWIIYWYVSNIEYTVIKVMQDFYTKCLLLHLETKLDGDDKWLTVKIPRDLAGIIDDFCKTSQAERMGINNKTDFLTRLITAWFSNYLEDFQLFMPKKLAERVNEISEIVTRYQQPRPTNDTENRSRPGRKRFWMMQQTVLILVVIGLVGTSLHSVIPALHGTSLIHTTSAHSSESTDEIVINAAQPDTYVRYWNGTDQAIEFVDND